jgi:hypothetical protein
MNTSWKSVSPDLVRGFCGAQHIYTISGLAWVVHSIHRRIDDGVAIALVEFHPYIRLGNDKVRCGDV